MRILQKLAIASALSLPLVGIGCSTLDESVIPRVNLYNTHRDDLLDSEEVEKYIRIEIAKGHEGPLSKEELGELEKIVEELDKRCSSLATSGLRTTRDNFLKAYDQYRDLIFNTKQAETPSK